MKKLVHVIIYVAGLGTVIPAAVLASNDGMKGMPGMPGMSATAPAASGPDSKTHFGFGSPGDADKVDRTIRIAALDAMRYDKTDLHVRAGETVRFVVTNKGKLRHEFVIGDAAEQREHAQMMKAMPDMAMHDDANGVVLNPGQTKTLIWHFASPGVVELGCHEPGHYEAGMVSRVIVGK